MKEIFGHLKTLLGSCDYGFLQVAYGLIQFPFPISASILYICLSSNEHSSAVSCGILSHLYEKLIVTHPLLLMLLCMVVEGWCLSHLSLAKFRHTQLNTGTVYGVGGTGGTWEQPWDKLSPESFCCVAAAIITAPLCCPSND